VTGLKSYENCNQNVTNLLEFLCSKFTMDEWQVKVCSTFNFQIQVKANFSYWTIPKMLVEFSQ
jgi:hypothetical protein